MLGGKHIRRLLGCSTQLKFRMDKQIRLFSSPSRSHQRLKIGVQSAPFGLGQDKEGVDQGTETVKSTGFIQTLKDIGVDIEDRGIIEFPKVASTSDVQEVKQQGPVPLRNAVQVASASRAISNSTVRILQDGRICLTLGGDHSIAIGTVHGASQVYNDLAVLWVDAHADLNIPSTTYTGNFHGMPLGFLIKEMEPWVTKLESFSWIIPRIKAKNVAYIGLRDVDPHEKEAIDKLGILAYSMEEVQNLGVEVVTRQALEKITDGFSRPLHLSFDIDALDDLEAKSTGTPVPGGLTLREALSIVKQIQQTTRLVSMDLVEVNPLIGTKFDANRTANAAKQILLNTFGYYRGGMSSGPLPQLTNLD